MEQRKAVKINTLVLDRLNEQTGTHTHTMRREYIYYGDFIEIVLFTQASLLSRMELLLKIFLCCVKDSLSSTGPSFRSDDVSFKLPFAQPILCNVIKIINMNQNTSMHTHV